MNLNAEQYLEYTIYRFGVFDVNTTLPFCLDLTNGMILPQWVNPPEKNVLSFNSVTKRMVMVIKTEKQVRIDELGAVIRGMETFLMIYYNGLPKAILGDRAFRKHIRKIEEDEIRSIKDKQW